MYDNSVGWDPLSGGQPLKLDVHFFEKQFSDRLSTVVCSRCTSYIFNFFFKVESHLCVKLKVVAYS